MAPIGFRHWLHMSLIFACLALVGCDSDSDVSEKTGLMVFAASSLTEAFIDLEQGFEASHPGVDVHLTFAGSQVLRLQIEQGAEADVFASANELHMQALVDKELIRAPRMFARNELVVIVPSKNPAGIARFSDLDQSSRFVIGTGNVPAGIYTRQVFERAKKRLGDEFVARVLGRVVSEENNVRLVRAKVELGEADAAMVYRTDASSSERVKVVSIPDELNARASYPIGALSRTAHAGEANVFVAYVLSPAGQEILARHGFVTEGK